MAIAKDARAPEAKIAAMLPVTTLAGYWPPAADLLPSRLAGDPRFYTYWVPRARGVESAHVPGAFFSGRRTALTELAEWLTADPNPADNLRVVSGGPGSGKSGVLARLHTGRPHRRGLGGRRRELDGHPIVVSGSADATVRVWDLRTGAPAGDPLAGHTGEVLAMAVGELDGHPIVVSGSSWDYTVRVWDMGTRVNPRVIRLGVPVHSVTKPKNGVVVAAYPTGLTALRF